MPPPPQYPTFSYFDKKLGRKPCRAPAHLSRVLYIPHHDNKTTHLPLYSSGDRYYKAIKQFPFIGSALYTTLLGAMEKPSGDNMDDCVAYLADMYTPEDDGNIQIRLNKRELGTCGSEAHL